MRQALLLALLIALPATVAAQNVPDPSLVHGKPLPAPELADGTLTVRVVREAMANPLIVDGRNLLDPETVRAAGFVYEGIGRPSATSNGDGGEG